MPRLLQKILPDSAERRSVGEYSQLSSVILLFVKYAQTKALAFVAFAVFFFWLPRLLDKPPSFRLY